MWDRIKAVNPLSWVLIILAAVLGYGAGALARRLAKGDEEKVTKYKVACKVVALVLAAAAAFIIMLGS